MTPYLQAHLLARSMDHTSRIQEKVRDTAIQKAQAEPIIRWVTAAPEFISVHEKPNMSVKRRVEWIKFKADKLNLELTMPLFMGFFKQMTSSADTESILKRFKHAVGVWQGEPLDWKALPEDERHLIRNICHGNLDCYCRHCSRVLDPKAKDTFCSPRCKSQYCSCGEKYATRKVTDWEATERKRQQFGPYHLLHELASTLRHRSALEGVASIHEVDNGFDTIAERREKEQCCKGSMVMVQLMRKKCTGEFVEVRDRQAAFHKLKKGDFTWGHCEVAKRQLELLVEMPKVEMEQPYCKPCETSEPARKKLRIV